MQLATIMLNKASMSIGSAVAFLSDKYSQMLLRQIQVQRALTHCCQRSRVGLSCETQKVPNDACGRHIRRIKTDVESVVPEMAASCQTANQELLSQAQRPPTKKSC